MLDFETLHLSHEYEAALSGPTAYCDPNLRLLKVRPPKQNNGISASIDLLRSFHDYESTPTRIGERNTSDIGGFEVWYDREELQFVYSAPSHEREMHYRRQLDGHFRGCDIEGQNKQRFITVNEGDYVTGADIWLAHHYFEPIRNKKGVEEWDDPYLMLFSELHTRDETRTLLQILFQPAEPNWTRTATDTVDDYSKFIKGEKTESKFFGLVSNKRDATPEETEYGDKIVLQDGHPAFYVNIRYLVVSPTAEDAVEHANNIATRFSVGYQEVTGQTLKSHPVTTPEEVNDLIRRVASRQPTNMGTTRSYLHDHWHSQFNDPRKQMIMTLPEIAGLLHFPKESKVNIPAIDWTEKTFEGSMPHNARRFARISDAERIAQLQRWEREQTALINSLDLPESATRLLIGDPKEDHQDVRRQIERQSAAQDTGGDSTSETATPESSPDGDSA